MAKVFSKPSGVTSLSANIVAAVLISTSIREKDP
jgi:hypothetical protein